MLELLLILINIGIPRGRVIALTFDDGLGGWHSHKIVRVLNRHNARATFFPRGKSLFAKGVNLKRVREDITNHEVGTHGWAQGDPRRWDSDRACREFHNPIDRIRRDLFREPIFYRPPSGIRLSRSQVKAVTDKRICQFAAWNHLFIEITWTYDTRDIDCHNARSPGCFAKVRDRIRQLARWHGDYIVLMHDNLPDTPAHVQWLLERTKGVNYVTLTRFYFIKLLKHIRRFICGNFLPFWPSATASLESCYC